MCLQESFLPSDNQRSWKWGGAGWGAGGVLSLSKGNILQGQLGGARALLEPVPVCICSSSGFVMLCPPLPFSGYRGVEVMGQLTVHIPLCSARLWGPQGHRDLGKTKAVKHTFARVTQRGREKPGKGDLSTMLESFDGWQNPRDEAVGQCMQHVWDSCPLSSGTEWEFAMLFSTLHPLVHIVDHSQLGK